MITKIALDFGVLEFYENIAVGIINEGVDLTYVQEKEIYALCQKQFSGSEYVYISNRIHSYSFDPFVHKEVTNLQHSLLAYAVVAKTPAQRMSYAIERMFFNKPCGFFANLEDAMSWSKRQLRASVKKKASHLSR